MKLVTALSRALRAMQLEPQDLATVELARSQAKAIDDDPEALKKIGPHLLETLNELRMTPKARNGLVKGPQTFDGDSDKITDLRSRRQNRAANLD